MRVRSMRVLLLALPAFALAACGGSLATSGGDGGAQTDSAVGAPDGPADAVASAPGDSSGSGAPNAASNAHANAPSNVDAALPATHDASSAACMHGGAGGGGDAVTFQEKCGGTDYQVDCNCLQETCVCFGPTTHVVPITSGTCPDILNSTGIEAVFALCGFPY